MSYRTYSKPRLTPGERLSELRSLAFIVMRHATKHVRGEGIQSRAWGVFVCDVSLVMSSSAQTFQKYFQRRKLVRTYSITRKE